MVIQERKVDEISRNACSTCSATRCMNVAGARRCSHVTELQRVRKSASQLSNSNPRFHVRVLSYISSRNCETEGDLSACVNLFKIVLAETPGMSPQMKSEVTRVRTPHLHLVGCNARCAIYPKVEVSKLFRGVFFDGFSLAARFPAVVHAAR